MSGQASISTRKLVVNEHSNDESCKKNRVRIGNPLKANFQWHHEDTLRFIKAVIQNRSELDKNKGPKRGSVWLKILRDIEMDNKIDPKIAAKKYDNLCKVFKFHRKKMLLNEAKNFSYSPRWPFYTLMAKAEGVLSHTASEDEVPVVSRDHKDEDKKGQYETENRKGSKKHQNDQRETKAIESIARDLHEMKEIFVDYMLKKKELIEKILSSKQSETSRTIIELASESIF